ncbi:MULTISPECIES: YitT family protein [Paenibacillus]|uniref:Membrane protein n=1 Tax=Paenibacillus campinasensis TaxID=66347 RepID=A0A268ETL3_9BACL|nr:YitT family protein [Paenibacillus campinasensis]MUG67120.1 YitT family protein [Paenibacillus campinasensis]PAD76450.1 membrane protein [Paenibacillus campinasensis]
MRIPFLPGRDPSFIRRLINKLSMIAAGSIIQGYAMAVFLFPHAIPSGGGAGIAVLLNHGFGIPMSLGLWFANIAFLLFTVHYLGSVSAVGTVLVITITSVSVNFFEVYVAPPMNNVWLDLLLGSLLLGTGIALLMKQRVSNGGIGYVALAIYKYKRIHPGTSLFWMNGFIFALTAYVIDWQIIVLAVLCQWLSTRMIHFILRIQSPRPALRPAWRKK